MTLVRRPRGIVISVSEPPPTLDYQQARSDYVRPSPGLRSLLWYLPPLVLFLLCELFDPAGQWPGGSHIYVVLERTSVACFWLGFAYIPAMIALQFILWLRRSLR